MWPAALNEYDTPDLTFSYFCDFPSLSNVFPISIF